MCATTDPIPINVEYINRQCRKRDRKTDIMICCSNNRRRWLEACIGMSVGAVASTPQSSTDWEPNRIEMKLYEQFQILNDFVRCVRVESLMISVRRHQPITSLFPSVIIASYFIDAKDDDGNGAGWKDMSVAHECVDGVRLNHNVALRNFPTRGCCFWCSIIQRNHSLRLFVHTKFPCAIRVTVAHTSDCQRHRLLSNGAFSMRRMGTFSLSSHRTHTCVNSIYSFSSRTGRSEQEWMYIYVLRKNNWVCNLHHNFRNKY